MNSPQESNLKYPKTLSGMMDVIESLLLRLGEFQEDKARSVAESIVIEIAQYQGGRQVYLPIGHSLKAALKHRRIFHDWKNQLSIGDLATKYETSASNIYKIIADQRALHRKRNG